MLSAIFMSATLLSANETNKQTLSNHNYLYSFYKPNKKVFIRKAKENYLYNTVLEDAYKNPDKSPLNMFLYALSNDYVYSDGSNRVYEYYKMAFYSLSEAYGYRVPTQYFDFLIRTQRYKEVLESKTELCGREEPQCMYYKIVAKYLLGEKPSRSECSDAMGFLQMKKMTISICD